MQRCGLFLVHVYNIIGIERLTISVNDIRKLRCVPKLICDVKQQLKIEYLRIYSTYMHETRWGSLLQAQLVYIQLCSL